MTLPDGPTVPTPVQWATGIVNNPERHTPERVAWAGRFLADRVAEHQAETDEEHWTWPLIALWLFDAVIAGVIVALAIYLLFLK